MTSYVRPGVLDSSAAGLAARGALRLRASLSRVVRLLLRWHELARERRALATMDHHMLKDIGLSRADVVQETSRWFWDDGGDPWRIWR